MMNPFIVQMINHKLNQLTAEELIQLSNQYERSINLQQANEVIAILKSERIDIMNKQQVTTLLTKLQQLKDPYLASVLNDLLKQFGGYLL